MTVWVTTGVMRYVGRTTIYGLLLGLQAIPLLAMRRDYERISVYGLCPFCKMPR